MVELVPGLASGPSAGPVPAEPVVAAMGVFDVSFSTGLAFSGFPGSAPGRPRPPRVLRTMTTMPITAMYTPPSKKSEELKCSLPM